MKNETKIILNRTDGIDVAVDKIIHAPTFAVILVIPKDAVISHSLSNFNALKRESDTAGKALAIESVDEHVLELALRAKIFASHVSGKGKARPVADGIVRRAPQSESKTGAAPQSKTIKVRTTHVDEEEVSVHTPIFKDEEEDILEKKAPTFFRKISHEESFDVTQTVEPKEEAPLKKPRSRRRTFIFLVSLVAVFLASAWIAFAVLPKATITLFLKREVVTSNTTVQIGKDYKLVSTTSNTVLIPGELFVEHGNLTKSFPASGKENVQLYANGNLFIYNAYSSASQLLVKSTRFESSDGKIFRLNKAVTVPGAKVVSGKLTPSKIQVSVTADKPGDEYNIQPDAHWTIPGFKGTPRYKGFYAESVDAMTGGLVGERPKLSDADRTSAEAEVSSALQSSLGMRIQAMADKLKTFASSTSFAVTKSEEQMNAQDSTQFNLFMEGDMRQLAFDENVLKDALVNKSRTDDTASDTVDSFSIDYGNPTFDFDKGTISLNVTSSVSFVPTIDVDGIKKSVAGVKKSAAEMTILGIPRLDSAKIAFWPFWVSSVPTNISRIDVFVK